jgi:hypothetical protein
MDIALAMVSLVLFGGAVVATVWAFVTEIRFGEYTRKTYPTFWRSIQPSMGGMPLGAIFLRRYTSITDDELVRRGDRARMWLGAMFLLWAAMLALGLVQKLMGFLD